MKKNKKESFLWNTMYICIHMYRCIHKGTVWQLVQTKKELLSGPHSAVTAQITLASDARTRFVPSGSASVSLPLWLCTWLPGFRSSARVTPQRMMTTALFDYISAGRSTHCVFYHWRLHLSSDCCIALEQFAGVSPVIAVVASFPQQTENWTFARSYRQD